MRRLGKYTVTVDGDVFEIEFRPGEQACVNQELHQVDLWRVSGDGVYSLLVDHRSSEGHVARSGDREFRVMIGGRPYQARLQPGYGTIGQASSETPPGARLPRAGRVSANIEMRAPLPGLLVEIQVSVGEHVKEQDVVAILESMKMNLELRAPRSGVIRQLLVGPGCQVAQDEVLVILGPDRASHGNTAG
jgi:biotin carboxyl carrier protein